MILLENGADPNIQSNFNETAYQYANMKGYTNIASLIGTFGNSVFIFFYE